MVYISSLLGRPENCLTALDPQLYIRAVAAPVWDSCTQSHLLILTSKRNSTKTSAANSPSNSMVRPPFRTYRLPSSLKPGRNEGSKSVRCRKTLTLALSGGQVGSRISGTNRQVNLSESALSSKAYSPFHYGLSSHNAAEPRHSPYQRL